MNKKTLAVALLLALGVAMPGMGKTYKYTHSNPCCEMWPADRLTLSAAERFGP